jgi:hypothetical protein
MNALKLFSLAVVLFAAGVHAGDPASLQSSAGASAPAQPALYSFADVYRLTVAGPTAGQPLVGAAPDAPVRVAAVSASQSAEPRFLISPPRAPEKWLLLLAGVALAGWVAHRRLAHSL